MGVWFDIYVATKDRSKAKIDRFLEKYVDLQKESMRQDFEVMPFGTEGFVETGTLQKSVELGLTNSDISFTLYLTGKQQDLKNAMVHFGKQGLLILGLSIEEETEAGSNKLKAEKLLAELKNELDSASGMVTVEVPPSELEEKFQKEIN